MKAELAIESLRYAIQNEEYHLHEYGENCFEISFSNEFLMLNNYTLSASRQDGLTVLSAYQ